MLAIDNSGIKNIFGGQTNVAGFIPVQTYTYDFAAAEVTVTDATTLPAGDTLARMHIHVFDQFSGEIRNATTVIGGTATIDVTALDRNEPLDIKVTIVTNKNRKADGGAYNLMPAGQIRHWDIQKDVEATQSPA